MIETEAVWFVVMPVGILVVVLGTVACIAIFNLVFPKRKNRRNNGR